MSMTDTNYAMSDVIKHYEPVIRRIASSYKARANIYGVSVEDLEQECRIALWKSCDKVEPYTTGFSMYIAKAAKRAIHKMLIEESCKVSHTTFDKHITKFPQMSDLVEIGYDRDRMSELQNNADDDSNDIIYANDFISYCSAVNEMYERVIRLRISGYKLDEISVQLGIKSRTLARMIVDIRKLYNDYTNGEGGEPNVNAKHTAGDRRVRRTSLRRVPHRR